MRYNTEFHVDEERRRVWRKKDYNDCVDGVKVSQKTLKAAGIILLILIIAIIGGKQITSDN